MARKRKKNSEQTAAQLSESFHGRPPKTVLEIEDEVIERAELAKLGRLHSLEVATLAGARFLLPFEGSGVILASSPDGRSLYFVGGKQQLDLKSLGLSADRDYIMLGQAEAVTYTTRKSFDNFEEIDYRHELGERGGTPPFLAYDAINQALFLIGGSYSVRPEGIVR